MDVVDLDILAYCTKRENWEGIKDEIAKSMCVKESWLLFGDISRYYEEFEEATEITAKDFKTWFRIKQHPDFKREKYELFGTIIDNIFSTEIPESGAFVESIRAVKARSSIAGAVKELEAGTLSLDEFQERIAEVSPEVSDEDATKGSEYIDIDDLALHARHGGFYWRLEDLNKSVGPISRGDLVIIAKRPEVGGTSFLCSELTFMLEQLPPGGKAVLFNNEEEPHKVKGRLVSTALGTNHIEIITNPAKIKKEFSVWLGDRELKMVQDTQMTIASVRNKIKAENPDLVGVNVLLKVGGTGKKEDHDKFQELGERFRNIALEYCPVLAIVQADPSAEGERFIPQDRIYKSKTALQGEADVLIMIGTDGDHDEERRFIYVAKNKIPPSACTETRNKHIKSEVKFDIDTGRFESLNFKKHSRSKGYVYDDTDSRHRDDGKRGPKRGQSGSTLAGEQGANGGVEDTGPANPNHVGDTDGDA